MLKILSLSLTIIGVICYQSCPVIKLGNFKYDLSPLMNADPLQIMKDGIYTEISPCKTINCTGIPTFIHKTVSNVCQPYTLSINPLRQGYTLIDPNSPQKGITIQFLPFVDNNQTYTALLSLHCAKYSNVEKKCIWNEGKVECMVNNDVGCPLPAPSYFWQFLSDNSVSFAIVIWIVSLFELLLGYFVIRITMMVFGMLTGLIFGVFYVASSYGDFLSQNDAMCRMVIMLALILGILFGMSLLTMPRLGYVNIGIWVAVVIGLLLQNAVLYLSGKLMVLYITIGVLMTVMTCVALLALKFFIIVSTSFLSAFGLVRPLGFFLSYYPNELNTKILTPTPWQFYIYLLGIIIITILGASFQFCLLKFKGLGNDAFYLEEEGPMKDKLAKLLNFKHLKQFAKAGKDQVMFFKDLITNSKQQEQEHQPNEIQMKALQKKNKKGSEMDVFGEPQQPKTKSNKKITNLQQNKLKSDQQPETQKVVKISSKRKIK